MHAPLPARRRPERRARSVAAVSLRAQVAVARRTRGSRATSARTMPRR
ncbi:hypothetical protein DB32_008281 [Sandaracinus amylolyticus]|uniref:Uncharacterized protein n=1 Tax=Sandaracinus amylolyticus TaxID=927083 RepID=A0A0F6YMK1_9BACT|nr:hypothetical protein DB32_008281 [Sandaracinus amylolyticus]